jgi:DNA-binding XRE family transcriptional regulator
MEKRKRQRLEKAGWAVGSAADFLELTSQEAAFVELKLALATRLKERRHRRGMTQSMLARFLGSSQPRVAKMEAGDRSVTLDLLVRSLFAMGATRREIARLMDAPRQKRAA